jgi:cytochrome c
MSFGRARSQLTWWIIGVAALTLLLSWRASESGLSAGGADDAQPPAGTAHRSEPAEARGDTPSPSADQMFLHLLGWGTGAIMVVAAVWIVTQVWMAQRNADAVSRALTGGEPARAAAPITRYGCGGCHTIAGLPGATGQVGPPLTGLRQRVFIAGVLPNTADNLVSWIVAPRRFSPGSAMPPTGIGLEEARDVASYLYAH